MDYLGKARKMNSNNKTNNTNEILKIFPKLSFEPKNSEYEVFMENLKNKGVPLHKHVYDILYSYGESTITYHELSHFIRYDKSIRKVLYKYLATFEEQLRAEIINNFDYPNKPTSKEDSIISDKLVIKKDELVVSNVYWFTFTKNFSFGNLIKYISSRLSELNINFTENELTEIKTLRNKVMHHSLVLVDDAINYIAAEAEINKIERVLTLLYKGLHDKAKDEFAMEINKSNFKGGDISTTPNFKRLRLGVFVNGIFDKKRYET